MKTMLERRPLADALEWAPVGLHPVGPTYAAFEPMLARARDALGPYWPALSR
jgi:hypothetical protein